MQTPSKFAYLTYPLFMTCFMFMSWWCLREDYAREIWVPVLTAMTFFAILGLEQLFPRRKSMNTLKDWQSINDIAHGVLAGILRPIGAAIGLLILASLGEARLGLNLVTLWPSTWHLIAQLILAHFVFSFFSYWVHRAFHEINRLWWFHAIHHDTKQIHVLKSGRFHFLDEIIGAIITPLPLILVGAPVEVILLRGMWSVFSGSMSHANVQQRFPSWFHYVISTVDVHNLHHSTERKYQDSNYTGMPIWDVIFGTFSHPDKCKSETFGIKEDYMPSNFFLQLWFPFKAQFINPLPSEEVNSSNE